MAENFDLNNLTLADANFETVPEGDYHFRVVSHEIGYFQPKEGTESKIPAGTQQLILHIEIPVQDTVVSMKHTQNLYQKVMFLFRQMTDCLGLTPEKGVQKFDINKLDGSSGVARFIVEAGNNGRDYNKVLTWYAPSKAPTVCENDAEWEKYKGNGGFVSIIGKLKKDGFVAANEPLPFEQ